MKFSYKVETKNFNRHIKQFIKKSDLSISIILRKFAFDLLKKIIQKSPVDTGRSRGAWLISMEKLSEKDSKMKQPFVRRNYPNYSMKEEQRGRGEGRLRDRSKMPFIKYITIINKVPYVIRLEYGHSRQAPFGMIRISMRELRKGKLPKELTVKLQKDWNSYYRFVSG